MPLNPTVKAVPTNLVKQFAEAFCFGRTGFAADEIPQFFEQYQSGVPTAASYEMAITKAVLFADCVRSLSPENQRSALYDLCDNPPKSKHPMPDASTRLYLLHGLVQADGRSPLGISLSAMTLAGVRAQWFTAASRIPSSPAGAITAARTLVESTCKTILAERGEVADSSGDLSRLYKQTRKALGIDPDTGATQNVHQIINGLTQTVDGIARLSNAAGDRHGLVSGQKVEDGASAGLAVHAAGTVSLFLVRVHKDQQRRSDT
jgi:hypothetical protein